MAVQRNTSVIADMAARTNVDLSSVGLTGAGSKVGAVIDAQQKTADKLNVIQEMKAEICTQLNRGASANDPSYSAERSSRHAIPEAESGGFMKGMAVDVAMAGIGFMAAGPAGIAAAGVVGAIRSAASLMTGNTQHQGTIHFGERGVKGGVLGDPVASSTGGAGKEERVYIDVMCGIQESGAGYKETPAANQPMGLAANETYFGHPSGTDMAGAAREAIATHDMRQIMAELGGNSEAEKRLRRDLGEQQRLMEQAHLADMSPDETLAGVDRFNAGYKAKLAPNFHTPAPVAAGPSMGGMGMG